MRWPRKSISENALPSRSWSCGTPQNPPPEPAVPMGRPPQTAPSAAPRHQKIPVDPPSPNPPHPPSQQRAIRLKKQPAFRGVRSDHQTRAACERPAPPSTARKIPRRPGTGLINIVKTGSWRCPVGHGLTPIVAVSHTQSGLYTFAEERVPDARHRPAQIPSAKISVCHASAACSPPPARSSCIMSNEPP
jgi:hypothetical protein